MEGHNGIHSINNGGTPLIDTGSINETGRPLIIINGIYTINDNGSINDVCHICRNYFSLQLNALMVLVQLMT
jgi:hypothetical protein